jgi:hypothetical protein
MQAATGKRIAFSSVEDCIYVLVLKEKKREVFRDNK